MARRAVSRQLWIRKLCHDRGFRVGCVTTAPNAMAQQHGVVSCSMRRRTSPKPRTICLLCLAERGLGDPSSENTAYAGNPRSHSQGQRQVLQTALEVGETKKSVSRSGLGSGSKGRGECKARGFNLVAPGVRTISQHRITRLIIAIIYPHHDVISCKLFPPFLLPSLCQRRPPLFRGARSRLGRFCWSTAH